MEIFARKIDNILKDHKITDKFSLKEKIISQAMNMGAYCQDNKCNTISVIILNAPCNGFGDLVFAIKIAKYIKEWYGLSPIIATTFYTGLIGLGWPENEAVEIKSNSYVQCRRFSRMKMNLPVNPDIILVAPIQFDFDPNLRDIQNIIPTATRYNTFSFSEYNDSPRKNFDFHTGIGGNRLGILLTSPEYGKLPENLKGDFALAYIAGPDSLSTAARCLASFLQMLALKYPELKQVVAQAWVENEISHLRNKLHDYYGKIVIKKKDETKVVFLNKDIEKVLVIRADILPVNNSVMMTLIKESIPDILLTGDQSITDCLSCCSDKNIFYQIAPWKFSFGKELAKHLPNEYYNSVKTSCGTIDAIDYKSNYADFVKKWDFRILGKPKMDAIFASVEMFKNYPEIYKKILEKKRRRK